MLRSLMAISLGILVSCAAAPALSAAPVQDVCDCDSGRPETLAVVNGDPIPTALVDADTASAVAPIKERMGNLREQALQQLVTNKLVELEAKRRGTTTPRLLQQAVVKEAGDLTDAEVRAFYDRNQASFEGKSFDEVREGLELYMRTQRQQAQMTIFTNDLRSKAQIQVLEYSPKAPATAADRAKVLAVVDGVNITSGDLEDSIRNYLYQYRLEIYAIERSALEERIDAALIAQEAKRRGMTPQALVDAEIAPKAKKVDAFDASKFYNENKGLFNGRAFNDVRDDVVEFLRQRELAIAKHTYAETFRKTATIKLNLVEPAAPTYEIETAGRPTIGGASAPVTLVVFSDFECPKCATEHTVLDDLVKQYAGKVRLVMRNYPLEQHKMAYKAAQAAEAAFEQGKYWEYANLLFANQKELSEAKLKELASQVGLDRTKFDAALESGKFQDIVDRDLTEGLRVGVQGTPSVFINGRAVGDDSIEGLKSAVDAALKERG